MSSIREYSVDAASTATFGRVLLSSGSHHFIVDGPLQNGCPGEAITPVEVFLAGVAACGVELVQVLARERSISIGDVGVRIAGRVDRDNPVREDLTVFNHVQIDFTLRGVSDADGKTLVESFKGR